MGADELLPFSSLGFPSLPAAEWVLELPVLTSAPSSGSHAGANRTLAPGGIWADAALAPRQSPAGALGPGLASPGPRGESRPPRGLMEAAATEKETQTTRLVR